MNVARHPAVLQLQRGRWLLGPALAASFPVVSLFAQNWHEALLRDAWPCWAALVLGSVVLAMAFRYVFGGVHRASLATVIFIAWLFTFFGYMELVKPALVIVGRTTATLGAVLAVWTFVLLVPLALLKWGRWSEAGLAKANQFVRLCCVLLISMAAIRCASMAMKPETPTTAGRQAGSTEADKWANHPVTPADWTAESPEVVRDIYYLVFDRYASSGVLKRDYNLDNAPFYEALEDRGFRVYPHCHSGYPMTVLSMSSTLNMRWHEPVFTQSSDYAPAIDQHEVAKVLKSAGYRYHLIGNTFGPLRTSRLADANFRVSFLPSEFADALLEMTPVGGLCGTWVKYGQVRKQFQAIVDVASDARPTFTYAHFLLPHDPYVFAKDGSRLPWYSRPTSDDAAAYANQVQAANDMILKTIDRLRSAPGNAPIIILQADEGPYLSAADQSRPRFEKLSKRTGVLSAVLMPDEHIAERLPRTWASVNTFRFLLREYLGAPLQDLPNRIFYWKHPRPRGTPFEGSRIIDVTADLQGAD